jgi:glycosyltransferase involved in cell wall biosynthesis
MRLLYISGTYAPRAFAGSELSAHTLLRGLATWHQVNVLVATDIKYGGGSCDTSTYDGLKVTGIRHDMRVAQLAEAITRFSPNVIFTQPWWHDVALRLGREFRVPTIFRVTEWPMPVDFLRGNAPPTIIVQTKEVREALCSLGLKSILLPAFIDLTRAQSKSAKNRRFITMFNPIEQKGGFLFKAIAESMPDREFAIVPGWWSLRDETGKFDTELFRRGAESQGRIYDGWLPKEPDFGSLDNVTVLYPRDAVSEIFDQTRILLVPSLWKEQFGRVIFEAAANGAAVIVSGMASLRDNAGDAAMYVEEFRNVAAWIDAIKGLDDPEWYAKRCRIGQDYVFRQYSLESSVATFYNLAQTVIDPSSAGGIE